jgi:hypothetical protein
MLNLKPVKPATHAAMSRFHELMAIKRNMPLRILTGFIRLHRRAFFDPALRTVRMLAQHGNQDAHGRAVIAQTEPGMTAVAGHSQGDSAGSHI